MDEPNDPFKMNPPASNPPVYPPIPPLTFPTASAMKTEPVKTETKPKTVEERNLKLKAEEEKKQENLKKVEDMKVELASKQEELKDLTLKLEGDKAEFAKTCEEKKEPLKQDIVKLQEEINTLVAETKVESEHAKILREHGGLESNIPLNHPYWRIRP